MNVFKMRIAIILLLVVGSLASGIASSNVVMTFDQLNQRDGEYVDDYYNGGCGSSTCGGPDHGVVWDNAYAGAALIGFYSGVDNAPSFPNVMGSLDSSAIMNVTGGFTTSLSFYYASPYGDSVTGTVSVYDGLNSTGNALASLILPGNGHQCGGSVYGYSCWSLVNMDFLGTAKSASFGGQGLFHLFDDVTIGALTPADGINVPEPSAFGMFGLGMLLVGIFAGLRRRFA